MMVLAGDCDVNMLWLDQGAEGLIISLFSKISENPSVFETVIIY